MHAHVVDNVKYTGIVRLILLNGQEIFWYKRFENMETKAEEDFQKAWFEFKKYLNEDITLKKFAMMFYQKGCIDTYEKVLKRLG